MPNEQRSGRARANATPVTRSRSSRRAAASRAPAPVFNAPQGNYVGVPRDYSVQQGYAPAPPSWAQHYGVSQAYLGVYGKPQYTERDLDAFYGMGFNKTFGMQQKLYSLGYLPTFVPGTWTDKDRKAAEKAFTDANKNGITLEQMIANRDRGLNMFGLGPAGGGGGGGGGWGGGGGGGGGSSVSVSKSYNYTSRESAQNLLANALRAELGREATDAEITRFMTALNTKAAREPSVSTSVSGPGGSMSTSVSSTVEPSAEAEAFARTASPNEHSRYAGSQYLEALAQMMGGR